MKRLLLFLVIVLSIPALLPGQKKAPPVKIIFDSDMGPDYDDVGAISLLHAMADSGQATILATIASTNYPNVAAVFSVLNTYFNRPGLPIGVPKGKALGLRDWQHWSDTLVSKYPHGVRQNSDVPDAVELYREILSQQPDHSVTIVTVGFLTNIASLLQSSPDKYSPLDGNRLVQKKVKRLVCMAGRFPSGSEFNVNQDAVASKYTFENWPGEILFSGFEIGAAIKVGLPLIRNEEIQHSPVKDVFSIAIPMAAEDSAGRKSWDETAVMVAIKGAAPFYSLHYGTIKVSEDGSNTWSDTGKQQAYLVPELSPVIVEEKIQQWIMHQPVKSK